MDQWIQAKYTQSKTKSAINFIDTIQPEQKTTKTNSLQQTSQIKYNTLRAEKKKSAIDFLDKIPSEQNEKECTFYFLDSSTVHPEQKKKKYFSHSSTVQFEIKQMGLSIVYYQYISSV